MKNNKKMCIISLNEKGEIENSENIEGCTMDDFGRDYFLVTNQKNVEIDETRNGSVYFKYINSLNNKIYMINLYVVKTIKIEELKEDINEIKTELLYRNEN